VEVTSAIDSVRSGEKDESPLANVVVSSKDNNGQPGSIRVITLMLADKEERNSFLRTIRYSAD